MKEGWTPPPVGWTTGVIYSPMRPARVGLLGFVIVSAALIGTQLNTTYDSDATVVHEQTLTRPLSMP